MIGGGTGTDVVFPPQIFPNAARPNNALAALWNDLDPVGSGGAGSLRIAALSDGANAVVVASITPA